MSATPAAGAIRLIPFCAAIGTTILGFILTVRAFYPGLMTLDSSMQLRQAQTGAYSDLHPPIMAWIWSGTNLLLPGPGGFLILLVGLYWVGFLMLAVHLIRNGSRLIPLMLLLPFMPFVINFTGTIWKDTLVCGCLLIAASLALLAPWPRRSHRWFSAPLVAVTLAIGCLGRHNSVLAAVPITMLYIWPVPSSQRPVAALIKRLSICLFAIALGTSALTVSLDRLVFHAERAHLGNLLLLWDLAGMSQFEDRNMLPGEWTSEQSEAIRTRCFDPQSADNFVPTEKCGFVYDKLRALDLWNGSEMFDTWVAAILRHPLTYVKVRLSDARGLFWHKLIYISKPNTDSTAYGFRPNALFEGLGSLIFTLAKIPVIDRLFTVGFWMIASVGTCILFLIRFLRRSAIASYAPMLVSLSGVLYVWPLVVVSLGDDLRYAYWTIVATCAALLLPPAGCPATLRSDAVTKSGD